MKNRNFLIPILLFSTFICQAQTDKSDKTLIFQPDISISSFQLHNPTGLFTDIEELKENLNGVNLPFPYLLILNKSQDQYLKMLFYPGGVYDQFSYFEVGAIKLDTLNNKINYKTTNIEEFITESSIKLGMSIEDFYNIKGKDFDKSLSNNEQLFYQLKRDTDTTGFLKKYNMPIYDAIYHFQSGTLIKFEFGFEYP